MRHEQSIHGPDWQHLDRVFPIVDVPSALLMKVKARCVFGAGAITAAELDEIDRRANRAISQAAPAQDKAVEPA
jgi:hypothetical protein